MKFVIYKDARGEWRWRLKSANNRIVADSGEGYETRHGAERACDTVRRGVQPTTLVEVRK